MFAKYSLMAFWALFSAATQAVILIPNVTVNPPSVLNYRGPSGLVPVGSPIAPDWLGLREDRQIFGCAGVPACISSGTIEPVSLPISGVSYTEDGVTYDVFDTGIPGIGYVIGVRDPNSTKYIPGNAPVTRTFPFAGSRPGADDLGYRVRIRFVTTAQRLVTGSYNIPEQKIATLRAGFWYGTETSNLKLSAVRINVTATGCTIQTGSGGNLELGAIPTSQLPAVGDRAGGDSITLSLRCDRGIHLYGVMTDQTNASNRSQILSLTSRSTAKGVGIQFFTGTSSTPVSYGPDQSAAGVQNQFYINTSGSDGQIINVPLRATYIRTGDLVPGSANGLASITFSYQ